LWSDTVTGAGLPFLTHRAGDYQHFNLITGLLALMTILQAIT